MSRMLKLAFRPPWNLTKSLLRPVKRVIKGWILDLSSVALEPLRAELRGLNDKMDRILDLNVTPDVLGDFRKHNETLRAIQADCALLREMNPLFNSVLR